MIPVRLISGLAALLIAATPSFGQTFSARRSGDYQGESGGNGGRFDLRVRVNGPAVFEIRGTTVRVRNYRGMRPVDAGCEYSEPVPNRRLEGLRLDQRDGRSTMRIVEEPSPRNGWAIVVSIDDRQRGDDGRHHGRITWQDTGGRPGGGGLFPPPRPGNGGGYPGSGGGYPGNDNWMVGRFVGDGPGGDRIRLSISPDGRVDGASATGTFSGRMQGNELRVGNLRFRVIQTPRGLRTEEIGNPRNVTAYRRQGNY